MIWSLLYISQLDMSVLSRFWYFVILMIQHKICFPFRIVLKVLISFNITWEKMPRLGIHISIYYNGTCTSTDTNAIYDQFISWIWHVYFPGLPKQNWDKKHVPYARHYRPLLIRNHAWILAIHKAKGHST